MMEHIETIELDSSQASITFSSIPQDYDDLVLLISARGAKNSYKTTFLLEINGTSRPNNFYETIRLINDAGSVISAGDSDDIVGDINGDTSTANTFASGSMYFSNYSTSSSTSISFDLVTENNSADVSSTIGASIYDTAASVTSIKALALSSNFVTGSTFSLYGITAGGDGTVTAS